VLDDALTPVRNYLARTEHLVVGLMTGTSADAVDAVLVRFRGVGIDATHEVVAYRESELDGALRARVLELAGARSFDPETMLRVDAALGECYAAAVLELLAEAGVERDRVSAIGSHGQTIRHLPRAAGGGHAFTLQIGSAAVLAERTGIAVVSDFRSRDTAAGGEGAPLVPLADWWLFRSPLESRVLLNLGGIANVTHLPAGGALERVLAFDTGPCNAVLDALAAAASGGRDRHDAGGALALSGEAVSTLLQTRLSDAFFSQAPPRSTGRERFGAAFAEQLLADCRALGRTPADAMATAVALAAEAISQSVRRFLVPRGGVERVVASGGGIRNRALMQALEQRLSPMPLVTTDALGVEPSAKEALAFALLAHVTLCGRPGNVPSATGATHPVVLGHITPGVARLVLALAAALASAARAAQAPPAAPPPFDLHAEPRIDVGLAWDLDSITIQVPASSEILLMPSGRRIDTRPAGAMTVRIATGGTGGASYRLGSGTSAYRGTFAATDTLIATGAHAGTIGHEWGWAGKTWRGQFKIFVNPRGQLTLASRLPLETYLLGVVPGEIGALDPAFIEAGRAQAVAARSYTLFYRGRRTSEGFDLYGTVEDQLYGPLESEKPLASRCVEDTRGKIAMWGGQPIRANYCSTCGGITAEVWEAWPADALPYLASHTDRSDSDWCAGSPQYRWRESWPAAEFVANVERFSPKQGLAVPAGGIGDLVDVKVEARSRSGRAWRLLVQGTRGETEIPAYSIRQVLRRGGNAGAILRSNLFKIDVRREAGSGRAVSVEASGAGSGHGVGLCQTGAIGMARAGRSAEQILEHYYSGSTIERRY
jgi:anhydro-N-acetylmuramic acid kinase